MTNPTSESAQPVAQEPLYVIFDGPPSHESGRFVEVENERGESVKVGEWRRLPDGLWSLGPLYAPIAQTAYVEPDPTPDCPCCTGTGKAPYTDPHQDIAQTADARDAARYRWLRDTPWPDHIETIVRFHQNAVWDDEIDRAIASIQREGE